ncbi:hypothetical protein PCARR_a0518 [Pseudoalteromonas carrageenovora IAM 12662]|uniref:Uncharacterized protein n=1 Tax=Pseudoalteromonas carrageenovora IAM 12662 TaxID=1314868 RepID=A0ABR9ENV2_PSEVC|nr:hypothetical protein [Pseudoalteromonas carrageenovora IAM 12662]
MFNYCVFDAAFDSGLIDFSWCRLGINAEIFSCEIISNFSRLLS